eukprot:366458-Chlamydomonas_euryale.AAC.13
MVHWCCAPDDTKQFPPHLTTHPPHPTPVRCATAESVRSAASGLRHASVHTRCAAAQSGVRARRRCAACGAGVLSALHGMEAAWRLLVQILWKA